MFNMPKEAHIGDLIEIIEMLGEPHYSGKKGIVTDIDDAHQLHGTWGGLAVDPDDVIKIIARANSSQLEPSSEPERTGRPRGPKAKRS